MANNINITGHLTRDPQYTEGTEGKKSRARFTVASDRIGDGADYIPVTVFGPTADAAAKHLAKGHQVAVTGRLASSSYEHDGQTTYSLDVIGERVDFLSKPPSASGPGKSLDNTLQSASPDNDRPKPSM